MALFRRTGLLDSYHEVHVNGQTHHNINANANVAVNINPINIVHTLELSDGIFTLIFLSGIIYLSKICTGVQLQFIGFANNVHLFFIGFSVYVFIVYCWIYISWRANQNENRRCAPRLLCWHPVSGNHNLPLPAPYAVGQGIRTLYHMDFTITRQSEIDMSYNIAVRDHSWGNLASHLVLSSLNSNPNIDEHLLESSDYTGITDSGHGMCRYHRRNKGAAKRILPPGQYRLSLQYKSSTYNSGAVSFGDLIQDDWAEDQLDMRIWIIPRQTSGVQIISLIGLQAIVILPFVVCCAYLNQFRYDTI